MEKLKLGIIGTGHLGSIHTKLAKEIEECEVIGVTDKIIEKAEKTGAENNVRVYKDVHSLLKDVDAVSIAATTSAHFELASEALNENVNVFIEKPITAEIDEAEKLVRLSEEKGLKLQVGHIERFNPALLSLEKYIDNPMFIQTDRLAQFNPRGTDVAVVLDLMIHDIDIILSLIKSKVKDVKANGVAVVSEGEDIANARIEFENGAVANVTASRISQKKMRKMRIFQNNAYLSLDFITGVSEVFRLTQPGESHPLSFGEIGIGDKKKSIIYEQPEIKEINALKHELNLFVDSVINNKRPVVSGADGLRALRIAKMIIQKMGENLQ